MIKVHLFILIILFASISLLIIPDLTPTPVLGQSDRSFKGSTAPFVPPSSSERLGLLPGNDFEFDDEEVTGNGGDGIVVVEEEEEEIDRDELPVLTKQELDELVADNTDIIEPERVPELSQEETTDGDDIDPISSIVEEIVKNESIIADEGFVPSPESSLINFQDQEIEQILEAQEVAPEPDNQTISTTEEQEDDLPLNVTEDDFEIEQADQISESESPDVNVQSFINEPANKEAVTALTDNKTSTTTATEQDNNATEGTPSGLSDILETDSEIEDEMPDLGNQAEEEQQQTVEEDNNATEGTPSGLSDILETDSGNQAEEDQQQEETIDETQATSVEEESPNTEPIAQDTSVIATQNQPLDITLNANDANGDNLSFTIVDKPSNGQLGNIDRSTNTITYTPDENYSGIDNFTFIVNDGTVDSKEASVSITVKGEEQQTVEEEEEQTVEEEEEQTVEEEEEQTVEEEEEQTVEEEEEQTVEEEE